MNVDVYYPITISETTENTITLTFDSASSDIPFGVSLNFDVQKDTVIGTIEFTTNEEKTSDIYIDAKQDLLVFYGINSGRVYGFRLQNANNYINPADINKLITNTAKYLSNFPKDISNRQKRNIKSSRDIIKETLQKSTHDLLETV